MNGTAREADADRLIESFGLGFGTDPDEVCRVMERRRKAFAARYRRLLEEVSRV